MLELKPFNVCIIVPKHCFFNALLRMNNSQHACLTRTFCEFGTHLLLYDFMLKKAFTKFPDVSGLIFHTDQGWQYQHEYFRNTLKEHGGTQSMSRKGNCYDNCIMETFFGRLKNEMIYGYEKEYTTFEKFSDAVREYIDYYNNERIQAKTKWIPPVKYREASMCST